MITRIVDSSEEFRDRPKQLCIVGALLISFLLSIVSQVAAYVPLTLGPNTGAFAGTVLRWDLSTFPNGAVPYSVNPAQLAGLNPIGPPGVTNAQIVDSIRGAFQSW